MSHTTRVFITVSQPDRRNKAHVSVNAELSGDFMRVASPEERLDYIKRTIRALTNDIMGEVEHDDFHIND